VYDNDFLPDYESFSSDSVSGWRPSSPEARGAWQTRRREITFDSETQAPLGIRFSGKEIDDFYGYNGHGEVPVGDIRLSFTWLPQRGDGSLILRMNRDRDEFTAHLNVDGGVRLEKRCLEESTDRQPVEELGSSMLAPFESGRAYAVELVNVDYRVCLKVSGQEVLATTDEQYHPDRDRLARIIEGRGHEPIPSEVSIAAFEMHCALRHVKLQRDVYYRSPNQSEDKHADPATPPGTSPGSAKQEWNPYYRWPCWGTEAMPILLRRERTVDGRTYGGEFFMLGDNSPQSKDSRLWWQIGPHLKDLGAEYQVGTVPRDQLIGEAFFVYWPSGYRRSWSPRVGVVPNFGRMRWIH
jgi:hypothetical protein